MKKGKGFTLIELLAVIVILAVIAIISTPIVLDVVDQAQKKADMSSANGLLDAGKIYYSESFLNEKKQEKLKKYENLWNDIVISGSKPQTGELYVNPEGEVALSVIYRNTCYQKRFETGLEILKEENCGLGFVGNDTTAPVVKIEVLGNPFNENNWAKEDFYITIKIEDMESGVSGYQWCMTTNDICDPEKRQEGERGAALITNESNQNRLCVIGIDQNKNESEIICSDPYRLDKTKPSLSGVGDVVIGRYEEVDLEFGVTAKDSLSGIEGKYTYDPMSVDTSKSGTTSITYKIKDQAGNSQEYIRKAIVETEAPTVTFTVETGKINANGWAREDFLVTLTANDQSGHGIKEFKWCATTNPSCDPSENASQTGYKGATIVTSESASNRICVVATDNVGNISANICSDTYQLDKTPPVAGTFKVTGTMGSNNWYTSNIILIANSGSDTLSGHASTSINTSSITSDVTNQNVTITTLDQAGNASTRQQSFSVDRNSPTVTAKNSSASITVGDNKNILSTYFTYGNVGPSSITSTSCTQGGKLITTTGSLSTGTYTISCSATKANGRTSFASINLTVENIKYLYYVNALNAGEQGASQLGTYVVRCDLSGNNCTAIQRIGNLGTVYSPALSVNNNYIYSINALNNGEHGAEQLGTYVVRCDLSGNNCTAIQRIGNLGIYRPAISVNDNNLYYINQLNSGEYGADYGGGTYVVRCDLSGNNCTAIQRIGNLGIYRPAISVNDNNLYYINQLNSGEYGAAYGGGTYVVRCDLNGANCAAIQSIKNLGTIDQPLLSVNNTSIYYINALDGAEYEAPYAGNYLIRCDINGTNCKAIQHIQNLGSENSAITASNSNMYMVNGLNLGEYGAPMLGSYLIRCDLSGNNCTAIQRIGNLGIYRPAVSVSK